MTMLMRLQAVALATLAVLPAPAGAFEHVTKPKDLHLETTLRADGAAQAVIVAPADGRYDEAVAALQRAIEKSGGQKLAVLADNKITPEEQLKTTNVIALGNMATNKFIERLYQQWYTFLDLWYPGKGGYVVRTLHNPYGTGRNIIFLGGSDDDGVAKAADAFAKLLKPGKTVSVGRLMDIHLGEGMKPPKVGETVYGWRDSFRLKPDGSETGAYPPAFVFGWHPISVQAALYYMTGKKEHIDEFKRLVFYPPGKAPKTIRTCSAFYSMDRPLVENYHYHAHTMPMIWDLIEESPLFTDAERLRVTNDLIDQQQYYTDNSPGMPQIGRGMSRHGAYHAMTIYTGSRYLARSYPNKLWTDRMEHIKQAFAWWLKEPTWGELDTLTWVTTSTEYVFDFFMLTDPKAFVESGTPRIMMEAHAILWTGQPYETSNRAQSIDVMHKGAYYLKDGRYIWLARQAGYDFNVFRIGQSWWPPPDRKVEPPTDLIGRVSVQPLPNALWESAGKPFPDPKEGFQFLSYRTGLGPTDDYFMLDGFFGQGRHSYHVNALYFARMGGRYLAYDYHNQITVRQNGMVPLDVPKAAALKDAIALDGVAFTRSTVPNMAYSSATRKLFWLAGQCCIVIDEVEARSDGSFEVTCAWQPVGGMNKIEGQRAVQTGGSVRGTVVCADPLPMTLLASGTCVVEAWSGSMRTGESVSIANLLYPSRVSGECENSIARHSDTSFVITGKTPALVTCGPTTQDAFRSDAVGAYVSPGQLVSIRSKELRCANVMVVSDKPISLIWDLAGGKMRVQADEAARVSMKPISSDWKLDGKPLAVESDKAGVGEFTLPAGEHLITGAVPGPETAAAIGEFIAGLKPAPPKDYASQGAATEQPAEWKPVWTAKLAQSVTHLALASNSKDIFAATSDNKLTILAPSGSVGKQIDCGAEVLSMLLHEGGDGPMLLVGLGNDYLLALDPKGKELWRAKAEIDPSFKVGDRYQAPWFTDPSWKGLTGVLSLLVGDVFGEGRREIVLGRASTVEFRSMNGELIKRLPIQWGRCSSLAFLSHLPKEDKNGPTVLVGKYHTGHDNVSQINRKHEKLTDSAFGAIPDGATQMSAWSQRGISHMSVADLDGNDTEEVIISRSGHWNGVSVYDGSTGKCLWGKYFGPWSRRGSYAGRFMRTLAVADLSGDGKMEVAVGMMNGWVCVFGPDGKAVWTRCFNTQPEAMVVHSGALVIGFNDGTVRQVDAEGKTVRLARFGSAVTALHPRADGIVVGDASGQVALLPW